MSDPDAFSKVPTEDPILAQIQDNVERALRQSPSGNIKSGQLIRGVELSTTPKDVTHSLGRTWKGFSVVNNDTGENVYSPGKSADDRSFLRLRTGSNSAIVSIWVF
jgi:hypothetical protein